MRAALLGRARFVWGLLVPVHSRAVQASHSSIPSLPMTTHVKVSLFVAALTLAASVGWVTVIQDPSGAQPYGEGQPIQVSDDGYKSSETCKACHPSQYDTWQVNRFARSIPSPTRIHKPLTTARFVSPLARTAVGAACAGMCME